VPFHAVGGAIRLIRATIAELRSEPRPPFVCGCGPIDMPGIIPFEPRFEQRKGLIGPPA
jgi:hypothetical protein